MLSSHKTSRTPLSIWKLRFFWCLIHLSPLYLIFNKELLSPLWFASSVLIYSFLQIFGLNIGLHRYMAHNSFKTSKGTEKIFIVLSNLLLQGSSLSWVLIHRHHHRRSDRFDDAHSPHHLSPLQIIVGQWKSPNLSLVKNRDVISSSWHKFFHRNYFRFHFLIALSLMIAGPRYFIFLYCIPLVLVFYASLSVVILCHRFGHAVQETKDYSKDNRLVNFLTYGEGLHNTHHKWPQKYRLVGAAGFDLTGWLIEKMFVSGPRTR